MRECAFTRVGVILVAALGSLCYGGRLVKMMCEGGVGARRSDIDGERWKV